MRHAPALNMRLEAIDLKLTFEKMVHELPGPPAESYSCESLGPGLDRFSQLAVAERRLPMSVPVRRSFDDVQRGPAVGLVPPKS